MIRVSRRRALASWGIGVLTGSAFSHGAKAAVQMAEGPSLTGSPVASPYQPFRALTGLGLNTGRLYIGAEGADPEVDSRACYWDGAGEIPALQPILIVDGAPTRLGSAAQLYTAKAHSIRVRDDAGVQVFYSAQAIPSPSFASGVLPSIPAAEATFIPPDMRPLGISLKGHGAPADGGGAYYTYAAAQAPGLGKFQSQDGAWWEIAEPLISVKMFGAKGDGVTDDAAAIQAAVNFMSKRSVQLVFPAGTYPVSTEIVVDGPFCSMAASGKAVLRKTGDNGYIRTPTPLDMSYPTQTSAGPMRGACFYFTSMISFSLFEGLTFSGFRFALAFFTAHNSPIFRRIFFVDCNVGIFCYQGCQNYQIVDCSAQANTNNLIIASATCFPIDSPYTKQDNYYTDGLYVSNEYGYGSFECHVNKYWDAWFQASIFRPTVGSFTIAHSNNVYPFSETDPCCNPSGRAVYLPFRTVRNCFYPTFRNIDMRGPNWGGVALINTQVYGLRIDTIQHEGVFKGYSGPRDSAPWVTLGCAVSGMGGIVMNVSTERTGGVDSGHPFYRVTGNGEYSTSAEIIEHINCDILLPKGQQKEVSIGKALGILGFDYNNIRVFDTGIVAQPGSAGGGMLAICSTATTGENSVAVYAVGRRSGTPHLDTLLIGGHAELAVFSVMANGNIGVTAPSVGNYHVAFLMQGAR